MCDRMRFAAPAPVVKKKAKVSKAKEAKKSPAKKAAPAKKASKKEVAKPEKKKKDPNAPKRGLSAFMFFSSANRDQIKKDHPDCTFGEVGKYMGEAWAKCAAKDKAKYEKQAATDKARYEKEMAKYKPK